MSRSWEAVRRNVAWWVPVLAAFAAVVTFVAVHHEPWRDEADSWLLVRDADLATVLARMPYAGTPGLWYVLIYSLPRLGLPILSQNLLHVGLATAAVGLFLWRAPLPKLTKVLFAFSYLMAYEYAVVARSYVLTPLLLFCAAALYPRRFDRPLWYAAPIALLSNANAHSVGIAGAVAASFALELLVRRRVSGAAVAGLGLIAAGGMLALWQLRPPVDGNVAGLSFKPEGLIESIGGAFVPNYGGMGPALVGIAALAAIGLTLSRHLGASAVYWISVVWLEGLFVLKYVGATRHHGLLVVVAVFCLWVAGEGASWQVIHAASRMRRSVAVATLALLNGSFLVSALLAAQHLYLDTQHAFSGAKEAAAFLGRRDIMGRPIAGHRLSHAEAVLPYLPGVRLWYLGLERYGTYMPWDVTYRDGDALSYEAAMEKLPPELAQRRDHLILISEPMPERFALRYKLLYKTERTVFFHRDEVYYVYEPVT